MKIKTEVLIAVGMIVLGLLILVGNLAQVPSWPYLWPTALILLGVWFLIRPQVSSRVQPSTWRFLGGLNRRGAWSVRGEDVWTFVGDTRLDLREAEIPPGETTLSLHGFIGDIDIRVPADAGVRVTGFALVLSAHTFGYKQEFILTPYETETPSYWDAERRVRIDLQYFIADLTVE